MTAYSPYLLPLLKGAPSSALIQGVANPIQEERYIQSMEPDLHPGWNDLAKEARRCYGMSFLHEDASEFVPSLPEEANSRLSPDRFLILEGRTEHYFVLEHPASLPLFDLYQKKGQRPALARPSLFTQWLMTSGSMDLDASGDTSLAEAHELDSVVALYTFLGELVRAGKPSDWHLEAGVNGFRSRLRIHGQLIEQKALSLKKGQWLINSVIQQAGLDGHSPGTALDGSFKFPLEPSRDLSVRVSIIPSLHGSAAVLRFLYPANPEAGQLRGLGMSGSHIDKIRALHTEKDGLWLLAGPTCSGKSTTLHALLSLSVDEDEKVLAIEDPVERILPGVQQIQANEVQQMTFARALRSFMRQAPDCILVGEIRDPETAAIVLQAANTGHRVLSSIHARDTAGVFGRFRDLGQLEEQVTAVCKILIHQRLIGLLCGGCREIRRLTTKQKEILAGLSLPVPRAMAFPGSCQSCQAGYRGRTGIHTFWEPANRGNVRDSFLEAGWEHLISKETCLNCLFPFLPGQIRRQFALCQS